MQAIRDVLAAVISLWSQRKYVSANYIGQRDLTPLVFIR